MAPCDAWAVVFYFSRCNLVLIKQRLVAEQQTAAFGFAADPQPAQGAEVFYRRQALVRGFVENGSRQRVAGTLLQRRRQT